MTVFTCLTDTYLARSISLRSGQFVSRIIQYLKASSYSIISFKATFLTITLSVGFILLYVYHFGEAAQLETIPKGP